MAKNLAANRLRGLQRRPLYSVSAWEIEWYKNPRRADVANQMTMLGWTDHDAPIRKAFQFFDLDERDPRHWRILLTYLAFTAFPNPKTGVRLKTEQENLELLARCDEFPNAKDDTELLNLVVKKHWRHYDKRQIPNLRKKLKAARRADQNRRQFDI